MTSEKNGTGSGCINKLSILKPEKMFKNKNIDQIEQQVTHESIKYFSTNRRSWRRMSSLTVCSCILKKSEQTSAKTLMLSIFMSELAESMFSISEGKTDLIIFKSI